MNKFAIAVFLCTFLVGNVALSQRISSIINSLKENKLSSFKETATNETTQDSTIQFDLLFSNNITQPYKVYVYRFDEARVVNKKLVERFYTYRFNLVCDGNKIISSIVTNISLAKEKTVHSYNDKYAIIAFDKVYKDTFGDTSHFDMLFKRDVIFGTSCGGFAGSTPPDFYYVWETVVETKNVETINKWLFCHLPSYRVWAAFGLSELRDKGYILTTEQRTRIETLRKSNVIVQKCSGCETFDRTESQLLDEYVYKQ